MLCSSPTIVGLFLQGSVVRPKKVWTALTAWIWRPSYFWLSMYNWDDTSEKKKNKFLYCHWFYIYIPAFYHFFFTLRVAKKKTQRFFHQLLSSEISQRILRENIFTGIPPKFVRKSCKRIVFSLSLEGRTNLIYFRAVGKLHAGSSISIFAVPSALKDILLHLNQIIPTGMTELIYRPLAFILFPWSLFTEIS